MVGDLAFRLSLPRNTTAARDARHDLGSWMPERCGPSVAETAMLLADELVANAVVHTRSADLDVRASCDGVRLRVCVDDETPTPDLLGAALVALAAGLLALGLVKSEDWGWTSGRTWLALVAAVVVAGVFARRSARHVSPVIDPAGNSAQILQGR